MFDSPIQLDDPDLSLPDMVVCNDMALESVIGLLKQLGNDVAELKSHYQELPSDLLN